MPGRAFAKPDKLFQVMLPVHYMKLSPLRRTQRAQNRMVEHVDPASEARLALRDDRIHRHHLSPISLRTCSADGKPFGCTIAGALSPVGM